MKVTRLTALMGIAGLALVSGSAWSQVKIAYIDPLSGGMANVGEIGVKHFQYAIDQVNANGGVLGGQKVELIKLDNKLSPQESLIALKSAIDQGARYITQGNGSGVAHALVDGVNKHNARNPDKSVLFLNYAAVDPELTNAKCSFWHFRFDANSDMKMEVLTNYMAQNKAIKKVYIIGQDYAHGHQVAKAAIAMLGKKRPDIQIVGNDLHPLGKTKDFAPYAAKIKASGADSVITGNWGNDMSLLVKAGKDAGLSVKYYTYYGGGLGTPTAMGDAADNRVVQITEFHPNINPPVAEKAYLDFKAKYKEEFFYLRVQNLVNMLADAINKAKSADPKAVALALEDARYKGESGEMYMRKTDHQLMQPLYISTFVKADGKKVKYDVENTGYGPRPDVAVSARESELPNSCIMERPN